MLTWIKFYNTATHLYRLPVTTLQKQQYQHHNYHIQKYLLFDFHLEEAIEIEAGKGNSDSNRSQKKAIQQIVYGELARSLVSKILDDKSIKVNYQVKDKSGSVQVLYEEATPTTQNNSATKEDVEFLELAVSQCINTLDPLTRQRLGSVLSEDQLKTIYKACSDRKNEFESTNTPNNKSIDKLFDELKQFEYDTSNHQIIAYVDNEKNKEMNKKSDRYLLLKVVERSIDNFKKLEKKKISESMCCSIFQDTVEVVLCNTNIEIDDGEIVSDASRRMTIINDYDKSEFGQIIDVLIHQTQYEHEIKFCGIEFKTQAASDTLLQHQQSKNLRINATMLNNIIGITNDKCVSNTYMDWWGTSGYMVQLFKQNNYFIAHHISSMHIPSSLLELDNFRTALKYLYKWRCQLLKSSQEISLALFQKKRKYGTITISSPTAPTVNLHRSPSLLPMHIFFNPGN